MYIRKLQPHLQRLAKEYPVITMTGPRQSGKTTLCQNTFPDHAYVNLEDVSLRQFAISDPKGFLSQFNQGVILDEIQRTPDLPSYIQVLVDKNDTAGRFVLTGSQQFEVTHSINQSLAGRTAVVKLLPLSYEELYAKQKPKSISELLYAGFYPRIFDKHLNPTEALAFYLSTYVERDIRSLMNIRDLTVFEKFLKHCAAKIGQLINYSSLANDVGVDQNTVKAWLSVLQASYIIFTIQPHYNNFRKRLTKSSKLYFYDVGLASYLLNISGPDHVDHHPLKGQLFENFVVSEFLKNRYNNVRESNIYFYRDHVGNEVDMVLDNGDELCSVEVKSSQTVNDSFFKGLDFYKKLTGDRNARRMIIYGGDESYTRNGVEVFSYKAFDKIFSGDF